jgi:hypothetical protein
MSLELVLFVDCSRQHSGLYCSIPSAATGWGRMTPMSVTARALETLVESELAGVSDARVVEHIRGMLVEPHVVRCNWDYGEPGEQYPCWFVFQDAQSGA